MRVHRLNGSDDLAACHEIRRLVFVVEQGVSEEEEWDDLDAECVHFLALDPEPIGTARLRVVDGRLGKAQRVAVLPSARGRRVGAVLMAALEREAATKGCREILLGAQIQALGFYESLGYEVFGDEFDDAGIPHRHMRKRLDPPAAT